MAIFKKIVKNLLIILGLLVAACLILLFVMYFFSVSAFGYVFRTSKGTSQTYKIQSEISEIFVESNTIPVALSIGDENKVVLTDSLNGIMKYDKDIRGKKIEPKISVEYKEDDKKLSIVITEPEKLFATKGNTVLNIFLTESQIKGVSFQAKTHNAPVSINSNETALNKISVISTGSTVLNVNANVNTVFAETKTGAINLNKNVFENAKIVTDSATISAHIISGNLEIFAKNSLVKVDEVANSFIYTGFNKLAEGVYEKADASGGKINAKTLKKGLLVQAKNINLNVAEVQGTIDIVVSYSGNISILKAGEQSNGNIKIAKGTINLPQISAKKLNIESSSGTINCSLYGATTDSVVTIKSTTGNINVNGKVIFGEVDNFYKGHLIVKTEKGHAKIDYLNCLVNATASNSGNITAYIFDEIKTLSSFESFRGNVEIYIKANTKSFINVFAGDTRSIDLSATKSFAELGRPTPIYNALPENDTKLLTFRSALKNVSICEFF